jgi:hypothetical protein
MPARPVRAALALLVVALGLAMSTLVATSASAAECTCKQPGTLKKQVERADVVFVGTVDAVSKEQPGHTYSITASRAYQGSVEHSTRVQSLAGANACGLGELRVGKEYLFLATGAAAPYDADTCGGTGPANPEKIGKVEAILGEGQVVSPPPPPEATMTKVEDSAPPGFARTAAPGAAAALLGLLGLVVVRRLARR